MKTSTILKKAKSVLIEKGWTKGELARNKYRHKVDPTSPSAVKFCAYGAIHNVLGAPDADYPNDGVSKVEEVARYLKMVLPEQPRSVEFDPSWFCRPTLDDYNDSDETTLKDMIVLFNQAIKLAKQDEKAV